MPAVRPRLWLALILALAPPLPAAAEGEAFDHYLLALTWMPSFCELGGDARGDVRCAPSGAHEWLVHGLWPQRTGGTWPEFCATPHNAPSRHETAAQAGLYGAAGPARHQWAKHGSCTGLPPDGYFALTRAALETLTLPEPIVARGAVAPEDVERAFIDANPGLRPEMMITTCRRDLIVEIRLCLTLELQPRPCDAELLRRACTLDQARLPLPGARNE